MVIVDGLGKKIIYDRLFADYDRLLQYIGKSKKISLVKMKAVTAGVIFAVPDASFAEHREQQAVPDGVTFAVGYPRFAEHQE